MQDFAQPKALRVLVAVDHTLLRGFVAAHLEEKADAAVAQASTLMQALDKIESDGCYDIVLLDLTMPGMNGLEGLGLVVAANAPDPGVLFSGTTNAPVVTEAIEQGARGFIPKTTPVRTLLSALRFIASGETYLPAHFLHRGAPDKSEVARKLSRQEQLVLTALCRGRSNKEIANELDLPLSTVKTRVRSICAKLQADNRTHAAILANQGGWISFQSARILDCELVCVP